MTHLVNKRLASCVGVDEDVRLEGQLVHRILIGEGKLSRCFELVLEGDVEVDQFILEHVGHRLRVGDHALNDFLIELETEFADYW